jgi:hypothetical protein
MRRHELMIELAPLRPLDRAISAQRISGRREADRLRVHDRAVACATAPFARGILEAAAGNPAVVSNGNRGEKQNRSDRNRQAKTSEHGLAPQFRGSSPRRDNRCSTLLLRFVILAALNEARFDESHCIEKYKPMRLRAERLTCPRRHIGRVVPFTVVRSISRRSVAGKSVRACEEQRLSHNSRSPTRQTCS